MFSLLWVGSLSGLAAVRGIYGIDRSDLVIMQIFRRIIDSKFQSSVKFTLNRGALSRSNYSYSKSVIEIKC